jgi:hypothetical protein
MGWATLWAIFSQTHLVTLVKAYINQVKNSGGMNENPTYCQLHVIW